jgi:hypothetical protein
MAHLGDGRKPGGRGNLCEHDLRVAPGGHRGAQAFDACVQNGPLERVGQGDTLLLRTVIGGAVVALFAGILALVGPGIGISSLWPFLLAAGIALAAGPAVASRTGAFVLGAVVSFVVMALRAGVLPDVPLSAAILVVVGVGILTLIAALTQGLLPLWTSLAGYAVFAGFYGPTYAASPTAFLTEAPIALVTVLLAAGLGAIVAIVAELAGVSVARTEPRHAGAGEVA